MRKTYPLFALITFIFGVVLVLVQMNIINLSYFYLLPIMIVSLVIGYVIDSKSNSNL